MTIRSFKGVFPKLGARAYVDSSAVVIGNVELGEDASIWPMCSIRGDVNQICIGARSNIQDGSVIHVTHGYGELPDGKATRIGSDVTVGHKVMLHGCTVEDLCLIGMDSVILDGAIIRSKVLLGAGSLVPEGKDLEGGYLWLGRPAKKMRELTDKELQWFEYSAMHYVKLKNDYME
jgi:carbonic anhydrase/acetyltransferase-like protein (isoleucine patch superfamily)